MKHRFVIFIILSVLGIASCNKKKYSEFTPGKLWLDNNGIAINAHGGSILYDNQRYYWFGVHNAERESGNADHVGIHCYSSDDLYNWTDEGICFAVAPEGSGYLIEKGCVLKCPRVIYNKKTGYYVMWFHLEPKDRAYGKALSGIAVSKMITGPYTYMNAVHPNKGYLPFNIPERYKNDGFTENVSSESIDFPESMDSLNILERDLYMGQMVADMTLFVDDDGVAYHIYCSEENSTIHIAQLSDDYLEHTGYYGRFFAGRSMRAPSVFKKDGKYYMVMSGKTAQGFDTMYSSISDSIMGKWGEQGNPFEDEGGELIFNTQSSFIFPVHGKRNMYIYMGDHLNPMDTTDVTFAWLPVYFNNQDFKIKWYDSWNLGVLRN